MAKCTGVRCHMQYGYKVEECNQADCPYRTEPITNGDRIRAMDDEVLSLQFVQVVKETIKILTELDLPDEISSEIRLNLLEKLKQPAQEV